MSLEVSQSLSSWPSPSPSTTVSQTSIAPGLMLSSLSLQSSIGQAASSSAGSPQEAVRSQ